MRKTELHSTEKIKETAVLVGVDLYQSHYDFESTMNELNALAFTCDLDVQGQWTQQKNQVDHKYYVGRGKLTEIQDFIEFHDIDVVVANDELTTAQSKNLNARLGVKVIDRTQLILEIFALRAKSKEGKLQVEYAQLDYLLPRLTGHGKSLSRLGGGIGTRGPGETKLETDRRHIRTRMNEIKRKLAEVEAHRERYRNQREQNQVFQVALIGYTNAGKSSWFNTLTAADTYEQDLLFATLDPKSRQLKINDGFEMVISDTVGFIQKLPTTLIEAFKSTLEEARQADLLIHVVDASHAEYKIQYDTVNEIVQELDMQDIPQVVIFNKKDLFTGITTPVTQQPSVFVSSKNEADIEKVKNLLFQAIQKQLDFYTVQLPSSAADQLYHLKQHTLVTKLDYDEATDQYHIEGYQK
ncbi:TPA: GTPase HflX [Staphylococcus pseudintermedius]|uniref:GTPase HflX n=1 Tax=Staphylococcus pseudintermedius TaxID=283734 RepID=UPI000F7BD735|nr:GTPase HflX [Staphylococcus pseudintermedius]EGQ2822000.1 GTPase HflX [Staphylococcus pseudintermedius]EHC9929140.1 GTPase HflX [Staphylococcus pseudintermedius]EII2375148.1 GTPase HflX [Staphylococcus pseudintermedius]EJD8480488.1 GTPase HflX [Staphylococcus pseudintermedius]EJE4550593.1 GTPase HflX [Staphylococcus pseudintermedius]